MAHFYGEIQGSRGATTRCGTKNSGMTCHVRGWDIGVKLQVSHKDGQDYIEVRVTSGSNEKTPDKLAGLIRLNEEPEFVLSEEMFPEGFDDNYPRNPYDKPIICSDNSPCEYQVTEDGTPINEE